MPGIQRASVCATWSNVLWSSLRTITRQWPPSPEPGSRVRGSSIVWPLMPPRVLGSDLALRPPAVEAEPQVLGRCGLDRRVGVCAGAFSDPLRQRGHEAVVVAALQQLDLRVQRVAQSV